MPRTKKTGLEQELAQTRERLERLETHFAEFVQRIAHDVQAPVKKILSFADLLDMKLPPELAGTNKDYLRRIENNASTLSKILTQLRDYAMNSSPTGETERVDMNKALADAREALKDKMGDVNPAFSSAKLPEVSGVRPQLTRLWQSLLHNALLYRRETPLEIKVGVKKGKEGWVFSVSDNGQGIAAADIARLFQIFPAIGAHEGPSTGIGLALCRRIVENHGGALWCESAPGQGSTFFFTLPR